MLGILQPQKFKTSWIVLLSGCLALFACGKAGVDSDSDSLGARVDLTGSISNQFGGHSALLGWNIVAIEKDTNICRVAEINASGFFDLKSVSSGKPLTLVLLNPNLVVSAVLSAPGNTDQTIFQYFVPKKEALPMLIHRGQIITFGSEENITFQTNASADTNMDGVPDGMGAFLTGLRLEQSNKVQSKAILKLADVDSDGVEDSIDPDIDSDGVPDIFDPDDDGDGTMDLFDPDANGDQVQDDQQTLSDVHFSTGVEWVSLEYIIKPQSDGTTRSTIRFTTKVRNNITPQAVQIRGPQALLGTAQVETTDDAGVVIPIKFDTLLLDDGKSGDGVAGDRLFSREVILPDGQTPHRFQAFFFQLVFGEGESAWFMEFPYMFPNIQTGSLEGLYESNTRDVQISGSPFGDFQDYIWSSFIRDANGSIIYTSPPLYGSSPSFTLGEDVISGLTGLEFSVAAQVLAKVPGRATITLHSSWSALE